MCSRDRLAVMVVNGDTQTVSIWNRFGVGSGSEIRVVSDDDWWDGPQADWQDALRRALDKMVEKRNGLPAGDS
jgi:hypothetical protein